MTEKLYCVACGKEGHLSKDCPTEPWKHLKNRRVYYVILGASFVWATIRAISPFLVLGALVNLIVLLSTRSCQPLP